MSAFVLDIVLKVTALIDRCVDCHTSLSPNSPANSRSQRTANRPPNCRTKSHPGKCVDPLQPPFKLAYAMSIFRLDILIFKLGRLPISIDNVCVIPGAKH